MSSIKRKKVWLLVVVGVIAWIILSMPYSLARHRAEKNFLTSRSNVVSSNVDEYDFICKGIEYGMNVSQVDDLMPGASSVCCNLEQHEPKFSGFVNSVNFRTF